MNAIVVDMTKE